MKRLLYVTILMTLSLAAYAQVEVMSDTIVGKEPDQTSVLQGTHQPKTIDTPLFRENYNNSTEIKSGTETIDLKLPPLLYYQGPPLESKNTRQPFINDYQTAGGMILNDKSWIAGGASQQSYLGTGAIKRARAIYNRKLTKNLTVFGGTSIMQYNLHNRVFSEARINPGLGYRINDRMNISLSGEYSAYRTGKSDGSNPGSLMSGFYPEEPGAFSHGFRPVYWSELQFNYQVTDWLYISPGLYSSRHEFYNNHSSDYGINAMMGIRVHEKVKFNLYGKKTLRGTNYSFGPRELHQQDMYGGGVQLMLNETFGIEAGMIREVNPWTGKWENKPYIKPVINIK